MEIRGRRDMSPCSCHRSRAATFLVSVTSGPLSREIPGPRDTIDAGGCPQKRMTRSWSAASRLEAVNRKTTKQTQFPRTPVESLPSHDEPRSADLAVEIRGLCGPALTDSTTPPGAASPHRPENQDSRRVIAPDSFVAQFGHPSSANAPQTTKQTQSRRTPVESSADCRSTNDRAAGGSPRALAQKNRGCRGWLQQTVHLCGVNVPDSSVAQALSVPRRDSSRRLGLLRPQTTKQTQFPRTPMESSADCHSTDDRAAGGRVCEKTGDCPKRHARTGRFINDLREARGLYPGFLHRPGSPRAKPPKILRRSGRTLEDKRFDAKSRLDGRVGHG